MMVTGIPLRHSPHFIPIKHAAEALRISKTMTACFAPQRSLATRLMNADKA